MKKEGGDDDDETMLLRKRLRQEGPKRGKGTDFSLEERMRHPHPPRPSSSAQERGGGEPNKPYCIHSVDGRAAKVALANSRGRGSRVWVG